MTRALYLIVITLQDRLFSITMHNVVYLPRFKCKPRELGIPREPRPCRSSPSI